jgi:hypothetical protein
MGTTLEDIAYEQYLIDRLEEQVWLESRLRYCVYLFVEGFTEERAFPTLFERLNFDFRENGIVIANYNGSGNAISSVRLLRQTLSSDRPILLTFDNDEEGQRIIESPLIKSEQAQGRLWVNPVPDAKREIVYVSGHVGGSFEEMFEQDDFLDCIFMLTEITNEILSMKNEFAERFESQKPWLRQVKTFMYEHGIPNFLESETSKIEFGVKLAKGCKVPPRDIENLVSRLTQIRWKYPIRDIRDFD